MNGVIKWFSVNKGEGLIHSNGKDYQFSIYDVIGKDIAKIGDNVTFEISSESEINAIYIEINTQKEIESRPVCLNCGRSFVPKIVYHSSSPTKSICPFCTYEYSNFSNFDFIERSLGNKLYFFFFNLSKKTKYFIYFILFVCALIFRFIM